MKAERTIAIIGDTGDVNLALVKKLAAQNVRLLLVSNDVNKNTQIMDLLAQNESAAKIEFISCEKEGCWEADIIAFSHPEKIEPHLVQRIKDVATQKVVLVISETGENETGSKISNFEELLPHSRVVNLTMDVNVKNVDISAKDDEAREMVEEFFKNAGYNINNKN